MPNNRDNRSVSVHVLLMLTVLLWASAFVGIRVGLHSYSPGGLALLRYLIASLTMIPLYLRYRTRQHRMSKGEITLTLLIGVFGIGVYNIALNYGEVTIPAGIACFIINQSPALTVILAVIFLRERLHLLGWLGFAVSCFGVWVMAANEHATMQMSLDLVYIIIAAVIAAFYSILQKPLLAKFHGVELTALILWSGTAVMLVFAPQLWSEIQSAQLTPTLTVIYLGIFPGVIAYTLWSIALAKTTVSKASGYLYLLPLLTTLMGWLFIGEVPSLLSFAGGVIALAGSVVVQLTTRKPQQ